jgi:hypothetical protein
MAHFPYFETPAKRVILDEIEEREDLSHRNTRSLSRTNATAGEAEVAAQNSSTTKISTKGRSFAEVSFYLSIRTFLWQTLLSDQIECAPPGDLNKVPGG